MLEDFETKTDYLIETKGLLKDRINSLGGSITSGTTFRDYLVWLDSLYQKLNEMTITGLPDSLEGKCEQTTAILPSEYTEVEYIQNTTGEQYIDTGIIPTTNTILDLNFMYIDKFLTGWDPIFGERGSTNSTYFGMFIQSSSLLLSPNYAGFDPGTNSNTSIVANQKYNFRNNKGQWYIDGELKSSISTTDRTLTTGDKSMYLFSMNQNGTLRRGAKIRIYSCKLYEGTTLTRDFIPCYRNSDNEIGLYDLVNNVFYTNQGTGTFIKGNNASRSPSPDYPQPINITTGRQVVRVSDGTTTNDYEINLGKNLYNPSYRNSSNTIRVNAGTASESNGTYTLVASGSDLFIWNVLTSTNTDYSSDCGPLISFDSNTFSVTISNSSFAKNFITFYDDSKKSIGYKFIQQSTFTFTKGESSVPSNAKYFSLRIGNGSATNGTTYTFTIQVEKGQPTSYTPYKTPIYLGKIGTYQDYIFRNTQENPLYDSNLEEGQWYIHKEIGRVVLNGSENWSGGTIAGDYLYIYCNDYDNIFSPNMAYTGISTHFKVLNQIINTYSPVITTDSMSLGSDTPIAGNRVRIKINKTTANTIPNFKTWLSTHNVEVYYVLNTPTNTLIEDEELINQLNEIEIFTVISEDFYN